MIWLVVMGAVGVAFLIGLLSVLGERIQEELVAVVSEREARVDTFALAEEELRERLNREPTVAEVYNLVWPPDEDDDATKDDEGSEDAGPSTEVALGDVDVVVGVDQVSGAPSPNGGVRSDSKDHDSSAGGADDPWLAVTDRLHIRIEALDEMLNGLRHETPSAERRGSV